LCIAIPAAATKIRCDSRYGGAGLKTILKLTAVRGRQLPLLVSSLLVCSLAGNAEAEDTFALRNQNPFLHIFGLPSFQSTALAEEGSPEYRISFDLANHADAREDEVETVVIDGETYFLTLALRRRVKSRLELGVELPLIRHSEGFLDNAIEDWHDTFGMSNSKRRGPSNQLSLFYASAGNTLYEIDSPTFGIGDIQITAAMPLRLADESDDLSVVVRSSVKLPTGAEEDLHGSGAADFSLGLYVSDVYSFFERDLALSGFAGALLLGDGDVLADIQRSAVPYAGAAATWQATENFAITTQLYAQGAYFDSELKELGGDSIQLAVGGNYRLQRRGLALSFAIVEDVVANATTDFGLHFSVHSAGGR